MKLRVATYNIHKGVTTLGGLPRIHALKEALGALDADIVFLQEVQGRHDKRAARFADVWPEESQHEFLAGESHYAAYGKNAVYDHGHHGNALLSRFPIVSSFNQDISAHAYESRGLLHCILDIHGLHVHCYVVHLGLLAKGRKQQVAVLTEAVRSTARDDEPVIIAGDFNDWENRLGDYLRMRLQVREVFENRQQVSGWHTIFSGLSGLAGGGQIKPARTFPAMMPWFRLDRIYLRGFDVSSAQVLRDRQWNKLSDHAPIITELSMHDLALLKALR